MASLFRQSLARSRLRPISCWIQQSSKSTCARISGSHTQCHRSISTKRPENATAAQQTTGRLPNGPSLKDFLIGDQNDANTDGIDATEMIPYINESDYSGRGRKVFLEVYGCQMNVNDTEIVWSILKKKDYVKVDSSEEADVVLLMTCSIREKAETKVC